MQPIELRVWLKDERKMYYQTENTSSCMDGLERFTQIVGRVTGYTPEVMRYTGLKDKKGVKIFGGDIIDYQDYLGIVKFGVNSKKTDVLGYKYAKIGFYIKNITNYGKEYKLESAWWQGRCKIIGNIYQNKDLLT